MLKNSKSSLASYSFAMDCKASGVVAAVEWFPEAASALSGVPDLRVMPSGGQDSFHHTVERDELFRLEEIGVRCAGGETVH